jgi:dihydroflavonol-4-reductase
MNLVTGAAGHLGNVLVRELLIKGETVKALVLPGEDLSSLQDLDIEIVQGNILNKDDLKRAFEGVDIVYHMAALVAITSDQESLLHRVNVDGTRNVIDAAMEVGVKRLIYTSSIHALERPPEGVIIDETLHFDMHNPAGAYDRTKAEASLSILEAVERGLDAVIVCPTGVIGPYDFRRSEIGEMILTWMKPKPSISMAGHFDFVDVRDVAQGHILAKEKGQTGETYLLSGEQVEISSVREWVQSVVGIHTPEIKFSAPIAYLVAPLAEIYYRITKTRPRFTKYSVETLQSNSLISSAKAQEFLGYRPRNLLITARDTVQWWIRNLSKTTSSLRITK